MKRLNGLLALVICAWYAPAANAREGALELRYTVDYPAAVSNAAWRAATAVRDQLVTKRPSAASQITLKNGKRRGAVRLTFAPGARDLLAGLDEDAIARAVPGFVLDGRDDSHCELVVTYEHRQKLRTEAVAQAARVLQRRARSFEGLKDADVRAVGWADVQVQLPGVDKAKTRLVREALGQTGDLSFAMLDVAGATALRGVDPRLPECGHHDVRVLVDRRFGTDTYYLRAPERSDLVRCLRALADGRKARGEPPLFSDAQRVVFEALTELDEATKRERDVGWRTHVAVRDASAWGLTKVQVAYDDDGAPYVSVDLDPTSTKRFAELTARNVNGFLAILVDDDAVSVPLIDEAITGGLARITIGRGGPDTVRRAVRLAKLLGAARLPAPIYPVSDRIVSTQLSAVVGLSTKIVLRSTKPLDVRKLQSTISGVLPGTLFVQTGPGSTTSSGSPTTLQVVYAQGPPKLVSAAKVEALQKGFEAALPLRAVGRHPDTNTLDVELRRPALVSASLDTFRKILAAQGHTGAWTISEPGERLDLEFYREYARTVAERRNDGQTIPEDDWDRVWQFHLSRKAKLMSETSTTVFRIQLEPTWAPLEAALAKAFGDAAPEVEFVETVGASTMTDVKEEARPAEKGAGSPAPGMGLWFGLGAAVLVLLPGVVWWLRRASGTEV